MPVSNFRQLFEQYLRGRLQPSQLDALRKQVQSPEATNELDQLLLEAYTNPQLQQGAAMGEQEWLRLHESMAGHTVIVPLRKSPASVFGRVGVAAALCALAVATWLVIRDNPATIKKHAGAGVIAPGKPGAILTLSDGRQLVLDSLANGQIASDNGSTLVLNNSQLVYKAADTAIAGTTNKLTTPAGRQFRLTLPDGTLVWLNAASSIQFPAAFTGKERTVQVTGEAYLEIAPSKARPFYVVTRQAKVAVLGTSINVSAYNDDAVNLVTLATGSVRVSNLSVPATSPVQLAPGQQAVLRTAGEMTVKPVNINEVVAWKNNRFFYRSVSVADFLKVISRWYNITVEYEGRVPEKELWVNYPRDQQLEATLKVLRNSNIRFELLERKLIIKE